MALKFYYHPLASFCFSEAEPYFRLFPLLDKPVLTPPFIQDDDR